MAQFIAMIGMSGVIPFLPLYVRELGVADADAPLWSGLIIAAPFLTAAIMTPIWGVLGDRYGRKNMVIRGVAGLAIAMTLMGFATNVWVLFYLRIFQGAVSGFVASNNAFITTQAPSEKTTSSLATLQTSISAGNIIGPLIGGLVSDAFGHNTVFFFVGALCLISLIVIAVFVTEERTHTLSTGNIRKSLKSLLSNTPLRLLLSVVLLSQASIVMASPILPFFLQQKGAPSAILSSLSGMVVSIVGICTIISAPWWGRRADQSGFSGTIKTTILIVATGQLLQAVVPSYEWLFPVRAFIGLAAGSIVPLIYGELSRRAPANAKGGVMGLGSSATLLGNLMGPLLCSVVTMALPLEFVFALQCILMLTVLWITVRIRAL